MLLPLEHVVIIFIVAVAREGLAAEAALGRGELRAHLGLERGWVLSLQAVVGLTLGRRPPVTDDRKKW